MKKINQQIKEYIELKSDELRLLLNFVIEEAIIEFEKDLKDDAKKIFGRKK